MTVDPASAVPFTFGVFVCPGEPGSVDRPDGAAGLAVLRSDAQIDLLVSDVGLPGGIDGQTLADAGRSVRAGLKVLIITGYAENVVLVNDFTHVLLKPFTMTALAGEIRDMIAASQSH